MSNYSVKKYDADSGRGTGQEKVLACLLTSPGAILDSTNNFVLNALEQENILTSVGTYFYRFKDPSSPFIKIGECTRREGVGTRFTRGWLRARSYSDSYLAKKVDGTYVDSALLTEIKNISTQKPAYFVFYEHLTTQSHPKIDEVYAYRTHKRFYKSGTLSPERMNGNPLLARKLVWHKASFSEVYRGKFPNGSRYD